MNLLQVLGIFLLNCRLNLFNSIVKVLLPKSSSDYLCEGFIDLHCLSRTEVFKFDVFQLQNMLIVNNGGSSHRCNVFKRLLLHASCPRHIHCAALKDVLLIVVDHRAHRILLQIFTEKQK